MIEGYSVDEAATVLGVPKGRVWELLARGILAGTPDDGGGMRVYLQGRPMEPIVGRPPEGKPPGSDQRRGANGNGGEHGQPGFEASPFRELLTEFRNLTERYGQALLALGESRGEVASLRTRVELLEARVDLRLPSAPPLVQWSPPRQPSEPPPQGTEPEPQASSVIDDAEVVQSAGPVELEPSDTALTPQSPADDEPMRKTKRSRHRRRARSATEGFAEALARAQDPTLSDLPGGEEAQAALDELRERFRRESGDEPEASAAPPADEPAETMSFGDGTALAPEVELDSFLADEELGGGVGQVKVAEVVDDAAPETAQLHHIDEPEYIEPAAGGDLIEAIAPADMVERVEEIEAIAPADTVEPVEGVEILEVVEPIEAEPAGMAEPVEPPAPLEAAESREAPEPLEAAQPSLQEPPPITGESEQVEDATPVHAYSHEWDEPDWIAEEDVDWGSGQAAIFTQPVAMGESPEIGWDELPAATASAPSEAPSESAQTEPVDDRPANESRIEESTKADPSDYEADPPAAVPSISQPIRVEAVAPPFGPPSASPPEDASPGWSQGEGPAISQSSEEELMWLGNEFRTGGSAWDASGRSTTLPKAVATSTVTDVGVSPAEEEALSRMAVERGWDDEELRAIRSLLAQPGRVAFDEADLGAATSARSTHVPDDETQSLEDPSEASPTSVGAEVREEEAFDWEQGPPAWNPPPMARSSRELPGAIEVDQAMAAFEVGAWSKESTLRRDEPPGPLATEPGDELKAQADPQPIAAGPEPTTDATGPSSTTPAEASITADTDWLRGRRGPAANAYRRLRRLFP